jgi:hypothetical protein
MVLDRISFKERNSLSDSQEISRSLWSPKLITTRARYRNIRQPDDPMYAFTRDVVPVLNPSELLERYYWYNKGACFK